MVVFFLLTPSNLDPFFSSYSALWHSILSLFFFFFGTKQCGINLT